MRPGRTIDYVAGSGRGRGTVDVEAAGLLRRIGQWTHRVRSPQTISDLTLPGLINYWPLEDPADTAVPVAEGPTGQRIPARDVQFAASAGPDGSDKVVRLNKNAQIGAYFADDASATSTAGWSYFFSLRNPVGLSTGYQATFFSFALSNLDTGLVRFIDTDMNLRFTTAGGTLVINSTQDMTGIDFTVWNHFVIHSKVVSGTVTIEVEWFNESDETIYTFSNTYSGTVTAQPLNWVSFGSDSNAGALLGHVGATSGYPADFTYSTRFDAIAGYSGETVGDRFARITAQEGVAGALLGSAADTPRMGPQRSGRLIELLQEMVNTDDGLLYDDRESVQIVLRTRADRYASAAAPALALTYPAHISEPFVEIVDDLETHNVVTVSDAGGYEYTAILASGDMSILDPPTGVGEYRQQIDVNVENPEATLPGLAAWWLNRGTLNRSRYDSVTVDLVANPGLVADAEAVVPGDVISITGYEPQVFYLVVIGISERIGSHSRRITFTTVPAELFVPGVYDAARYDVENSTTNASQTTTSTSWAIKAADLDSVWSTTSLPYSWLVEGEMVTVTAMTAATGSGPYTQTAAVARSVNGVVKTHPSDAPIHIANPGRYAL